MSATAPTTKLEAVNRMLADIGDRPVNTLSGSQRLDVNNAVAALDEATRTLLATGWWFNTEKLRVPVDANDQYLIPTDIVKVEAIDGGPTSGQYEVPYLVVRGRKLYDTANATDTFPGGPLVVLIVCRLLDYEDLPQNAREYVYATASLALQFRTIGSGVLDQNLQMRAATALAQLKDEEIENTTDDLTFAPRFIDIMYRR